MDMAIAVVGSPMQTFDASNNLSNLNLNILSIIKVINKCINTASKQNTSINGPNIFPLSFLTFLMSAFKSNSGIEQEPHKTKLLKKSIKPMYYHY